MCSYNAHVTQQFMHEPYHIQPSGALNYIAMVPRQLVLVMIILQWSQLINCQYQQQKTQSFLDTLIYCRSNV